MKYKINRNQPPLTDEELASARSFNRVLKGYHAIKVPFYKSGRFLTSGSALIVAAAIALIVLFDDKTETPQQPFISPPLAQALIASDTFMIDAESPTDIAYKSGSKLHILAGAFTDAKGHPIKGKVTLKYREFHDQRDIFLSGIPMTYDSAGTTYVFESAGMMEIGASQNGMPLAVNAAKPIKVDMVSHTKEDRFNTYYLDTVTKKWVNLNQANLNPKQFVDTALHDEKPDPLLAKCEQALKQTAALVKAAEKEKPMPIVKADDAKTKFHIQIDSAEFPEIAVYKGVSFQVKDEKAFDMASARKTWSDVKLKKLDGSDYEVTFSRGSKLFKVVASPVLEDKDLAAAQKVYDLKFARYESILSERKATEEKAKQEMKRIMADQSLRDSFYESHMNASQRIYRAFSVSQFGFYNCDQPRIIASDANVIAIVSDENNKPLKLTELCLVEKSINMVCSYHSVDKQCKDFKFNTAQDNMLWGVTADNKLAVINVNSFKSQQAKSGEVHFRFQIIDKDFKNSEEVKKYLEI
jgi:hypothetical protein